MFQEENNRKWKLRECSIFMQALLQTLSSMTAKLFCVCWCAPRLYEYFTYVDTYIRYECIFVCKKRNKYVMCTYYFFGTFRFMMGNLKCNIHFLSFSVTFFFSFISTAFEFPTFETRDRTQQTYCDAETASKFIYALV